jgi:hypothetical protein
MQGLEPRLRAPKARALAPTRHPVVGIEGFEPPASRPRTERPTKLGHIPLRGDGGNRYLQSVAASRLRTLEAEVRDLRGENETLRGEVLELRRRTRSRPS